jgi:beta-glucosidase
VLLKNDHGVLPLAQDELNSIAVIGPLADEPVQQLGTWIFDGDASLSVTPLTAIASMFPETVSYTRAMHTSRSHDQQGFDEAVAAAEAADVAVLFLGEESILSGEAHSRADITLPGAQAELVRRIREVGKPVVAVIQAGRPLVLTNILDEVDAILFAWHAGTMAGPAIADLLFGHASPSGKLPATFPNMVGQIPIYYNHKNTGKPPSPHTVELIDDIDANATQLSTGMTAYHMDAGYLPLFPFGFGLSYTHFGYHNLALSSHELRAGGSITASVDLTNHGTVTAKEVVQLYVRDLVGNVTRPVRELKGFQKVQLHPGETRRVEFTLTANDLAFYNRNMQLVTEAGEFHLWIGGSSAAELQCVFHYVE